MPRRRSAQDTRTPRPRVAREATQQPDWSDTALNILLDFTQIFGAASLLEAAQGMWAIASELRVAYVGVAFLCSFFVISILHTVSAALEVFEAEFEKNWAVLGLNWTVNFSGLLFIIANISVGDYSLPWFSMIAPGIQTIVLAYALKNVPRKAGGIRLVLLMAHIVVLAGYCVYVHELSWCVERICTEISIRRYDGHDTDALGELYAVDIPPDCFDVGRLLGDSAVVARDSSDEQQVFIRASCRDRACSAATTALTSSTTQLHLFNEFPNKFQWGGVIEDVVVAVVIVSIVVVGGSFVNLIVPSRWPMDKSPNSHKACSKAFIVIGWIGTILFSSCFGCLASSSVG